MPVLNAVRIWILLSTLLVASGWVLSAFHGLNRAGYGAVFILAAGAVIFWQRKTSWRPKKSPAQWWQKFKRRFKRPAPLLFLTLVVMALAAGVLYVPQNNDTNEYRIPRVWHWLAEGHWHWIRTLDFRMNVAGCNFEWLMAPLMLFTRHDRFLTLINWLSFLMLPGLIFSVFTRWQVRPRVAWWWMWILPSGWCYAMQAGSDVNDSFPVIYALASVDFALRAREKNSVSDLWFSVLAVALLTGSKQTNFPLVLPWLVAVLPAWRLVKHHMWGTVCLCLPALLVSAVPLAWFNFRHTGYWLGNFTPSPIWKLQPPPPLWCLIGNLFCLPIQNLHPPYFPLVDRWDELMNRFLQTSFGSHFRLFEWFAHLGPGASEGNAGIGLWIVLLLLVSMVAAGFYRGSQPVQNRWLFWLRWIPFLSLSLFMAKIATFQNARQLSAYYVLLFPALLACSGHAKLVRRKWWQISGLATIFLTAALLVVARDRPLFPAKTILLPLTVRHPQWKFLARAWESYACRLSVDAQRNAFRNTLPADEKVLGYATVRGAQEPGQWVPFGRRLVVRVLPDDTSSALQARGIHYVLLDEGSLDLQSTTIGDWTNQFGAILVDSIEFEASPGTTTKDYLVRLR